MTLPVSSVGDLWTAASEQQLAAFFNNAAAAWSAYSPTLTASVTNPTLGASPVQVGSYIQLGKTVIGTARVAFGTSGTNAGSGVYSITLPATAAGSVVLCGFGVIVCAGLMTNVRLNSDGRLRYVSAAVNGTSVNVANTGAPGAWTVNDSVEVCFAYQST